MQILKILKHLGEVLEKKFLSGMDAPKGMSVLKKVLYVTDIDTVRGFDLESKKEVFTLKIDGAVFLNDIAKGKDKYIFVSDTGTGLIHRINVESKMYRHITKEPLGGVNGLYLDDKEKVMYAVTYVEPHDGRVYKLDMKEKMGEIVPVVYSKLKGMLDGVAKLKDGSLVVSDWGVNLEGGVYEISNNATVSKLELPLVKGPADLYVSGKYIWIPLMAENRVLRVEIGRAHV